MREIILNNYPPVIKQIREMQQIARAEDIEFSKLKASTQEVIRNMFVFTANDLGVRRFEKILGITPKAAQSLDDRKLYIISMMNRRKMSLSELTAMLSNYSEGIELINDMSNMEMIVTINTDAGSLETLNNIIDEILPLNIYFEFSLQRETVIKYKMEDLIFMAFEPAAAETEYCNFDNNITEKKKADYVQSIAGFSFVNPVSSTGQMICGLEYCLAMQAPYEAQEGVISIETHMDSTETPLKVCDDAVALGEDPPFEVKEAITAIATEQSGSTTPIRSCDDPAALGADPPFAMREAAVAIEIEQSGSITPIRSCNDPAALGTDPPCEMQQSAVEVQQSKTQAANTPMICGTDYAREEV